MEKCGECGNDNPKYITEVKNELGTLVWCEVCQSVIRIK